MIATYIAIILVFLIFIGSVIHFYQVVGLWLGLAVQLVVALVVILIVLHAKSLI